MFLYVRSAHAQYVIPLFMVCIENNNIHITTIDYSRDVCLIWPMVLCFANSVGFGQLAVCLMINALNLIDGLILHNVKKPKFVKFILNIQFNIYVLFDSC